MVTNVGNQTKFIDAIKELIELDYDAVDTYKLAIEKLKNLEYKDKFYEFKGDQRWSPSVGPDCSIIKV